MYSAKLRRTVFFLLLLKTYHRTELNYWPLYHVQKLICFISHDKIRHGEMGERDGAVQNTSELRASNLSRNLPTSIRALLSPFKWVSGGQGRYHDLLPRVYFTSLWSFTCLRNWSQNCILTLHFGFLLNNLLQNVCHSPESHINLVLTAISLQFNFPLYQIASCSLHMKLCKGEDSKKVWKSISASQNARF